MEIIEETEEKIVYQEGKTRYTMHNMGSFVGHETREWYVSSPDFWKLTELDKELDDGQKLHIEALIDSRTGNYTRIIIRIGSVQRTIQLSNGFVFNDVVDGSAILDSDIIYGEKIPLGEYLTREIKFNELVSDFLNQDERLRGELLPKKGKPKK